MAPHPHAAQGKEPHQPQGDDIGATCQLHKGPESPAPTLTAQPVSGTRGRGFRTLSLLLSELLPRYPSTDIPSVCTVTMACPCAEASCGHSREKWVFRNKRINDSMTLRSHDEAMGLQAMDATEMSSTNKGGEP